MNLVFQGLIISYTTEDSYFVINAQWAYLDYHVDKKNIMTKFFSSFFLLQNTLKYVKINVTIHLKRKKTRMAIAKPII